MLDEYIKELITKNNRVIVPNFGAFLLRATSKNKGKKELSAKIDDIYFSPFLKFNDELLANYLMKKENLGQKEAMDKITQYIKSIEDAVKEKGSYQIEGLGEFYMDSQGKVQFKVRSSAQEDDSKQAPTPKEPPKKEVPKKETPKSSSTINEKMGAPKPRPAAAPKPEESDKAAPEKKETSAPGMKAEKVQPVTRTTSKTPPPPPRKEKMDAGESGSKGNKGLIMSIAIGVPIAVIFIWAMLNFDTVQDLFSKDSRPRPVTEEMKESKEKPDQNKSGQQAEQAKSSAESASNKQSEQTSRSESVEEQKASKQQTSQKSTGGKKYYIVAGSFKKRQNALNFQKKLINQGYDSEMIGERNGMHAVSYAAFKNKERAENELSKLKNEKGVQAWLLYY